MSGLPFDMKLKVTRQEKLLQVLQLESSSGMCAKFRTVAASYNRDHVPWSLYYCFFVPHIYGVVLRAHSVHGEPRIQHNASTSWPILFIIFQIRLNTPTML